jgi:vesicle coat complex subunit
MRLLEFINNAEFVKNMCKKMTPPLVTLLQKEPEIQYVALRNINLIIQKRPQVLQNEMKVFFCKYNDPIYVKMEKLEIMIMLVTERTIEQAPFPVFLILFILIILFVLYCTKIS